MMDRWALSCAAVLLGLFSDSADRACYPLQMLEKLLDRTHLEKHTKAPYPDVGVGYEMVQANDGSGLLSGVE